MIGRGTFVHQSELWRYEPSGRKFIFINQRFAMGALERNLGGLIVPEKVPSKPLGVCLDDLLGRSSATLTSDASLVPA